MVQEKTCRPVRSINATGPNPFTFPFVKRGTIILGSSSADTKSATLRISIPLRDNCPISELPQKVRSRMVPAAERINPVDAAFSPFRRCVI